MRENDLIAEYVKENYPEILTTFDFACFKLRVTCQEFGKAIAEEIKKIDFSGLNKALREAGEAAKAAEIPGFDQKDCTGCKYERSTNINEHMKFCNYCKRDKTDEEARDCHEDLYEAKENNR